MVITKKSFLNHSFLCSTIFHSPSPLISLSRTRKRYKFPIHNHTIRTVLIIHIIFFISKIFHCQSPYQRSDDHRRCRYHIIPLLWYRRNNNERQHSNVRHIDHETFGIGAISISAQTELDFQTRIAWKDFAFVLIFFFIRFAQKYFFLFLVQFSMRCPFGLVLH